jgi:proteic killer suppression protein
MIVTFAHEYLEDLYYEGAAKGKKHRFQPWVIKNYQVCIDTLFGAESIEDIKRDGGLRYEMLKGDKKGVSSIRVNRKYRVEFTVRPSPLEPIATVCNITELSNHYG